MSAPTAQEATGESRSLTAAGVTLLGVLLSIGTTVAFGMGGPAPLRILAGASCTVALAVLVKIATRHGRGPLARLAKWIISAPPGE